MRFHRRTVLGLAAALAAKPALAREPENSVSLLGLPLLWHLESLEAVRERWRRSDTTLQPARDALLKDADAALLKGPYTVANKGRPPPSGNRQDYTSLAPYWWPDPAQPDGLPYVQRDGEINPERNGNNFDRVRIGNLISDVKVLGLAFWFTSDSRYADKADQLINVWFNDADTRMNPNLNFGQSIPGRTDGRGIGIIDTHRMGELIDSVQLLARQGGLDAQTYQGVRLWFRDYTKWLVTSPLGLDERAAKNNHGTYYDLQVMHYALFFGDRDFARARFKDSKRRIDSQISAYGRMPLEEKRTRSLHYYIFNSLAFIGIGELSRHVGGGFFEYQGRRGQSLRKTLLYLAPYAASQKTWPHQQIGRSSQSDLAFLMQKAASYYEDRAIRDAARRSRPLLASSPDRLVLPVGPKDE